MKSRKSDPKRMYRLNVVAKLFALVIKLAICPCFNRGTILFFAIRRANETFYKIALQICITHHFGS